MFSKIFEKAIILILIIILSKYNVLAGLGFLFVYIYFSENTIIENFDKNKQIRQQSSLRNTENSQTNNLSSSSDKHNINTNNIKYTKDNVNTEQQDDVKPMSNNYEEGSIPNKIAKQQSDLINNTDENDENLFRNKYCNQNGILVKNGNIVNDVNESFPNLKYINEECNPCDTSCKFDIISTDEQLTTIENLKSMDSNTIQVDRKKTIKKNN